MSPRRTPSIARARADWLGARAALAGRRRARFVFLAILSSAILGAVLAATPVRTLSDRPPLGALVGVVVVVGVIIGFLLNLVAEMGRPAVADAREAEQLARVAVLATVRRVDGDIDPYHLLHLALSATGAQSHVIAIAGDESAVVSAVASQLALAAAEESRATVLLDTDAERSGVAAWFDQRPEPGFSDAMAGVRLWSEVTRAVGARRELPIEIIPGGAVRAPLDDDASRRTARDELARFCAQYDLSVFAVCGATSLRRLHDASVGVPIIWCARIGATSHARLQKELADIRAAGFTLRGLFLWDARVPPIRSRGEQMARTRTL